MSSFHKFKVGQLVNLVGAQRSSGSPLEGRDHVVAQSELEEQQNP
jgi:hypothetical protein